MDECAKMAQILGKRWTGIQNDNTWTRNCNYWASSTKRDQEFFFNKYAGNNKGTLSQQACKKEVIDTRSP